MAKGSKNKNKTDSTNDNVKTNGQNTNVKKEKIKLENDQIVLVRNNTGGRLYYENHNTGDEFYWNNYGELLELTVADLKAMKSKYIKFFKQQWVSIIEVEDCEYSIEEVYEYLRISQYYNELGFDFDIEDTIVNKTANQIKTICQSLPTGIVSSFIAIANSMIESEELYDQRKIKAIEEVFNIELSDGNSN